MEKGGSEIVQFEVGDPVTYQNIRNWNILRGITFMMTLWKCIFAPING